jgi:hypothetical protein
LVTGEEVVVEDTTTGEEAVGEAGAGEEEPPHAVVKRARARVVEIFVYLKANSPGIDACGAPIAYCLCTDFRVTE